MAKLFTRAFWVIGLVASSGNAMTAAEKKLADHRKRI
jgi:hypothetical protein